MERPKMLSELYGRIGQMLREHGDAPLHREWDNCHENVCTNKQKPFADVDICLELTENHPEMKKYVLNIRY